MEGRPQISPEKTKNDKIQELRRAIRRAEENNEEKKVLLLEAELRAVEQDVEFDREQFLRDYTHKKKIRKPTVLRELLRLAEKSPDNVWMWDGLDSRDSTNAAHSYEKTFSSLLKILGISDFQELVDEKSDTLDHPINVLDLFGGAYFLDDLTNVSRITGVRLENVDQWLLLKARARDNTRVVEEMVKLIEEPKRNIIEGDLYKRKTWMKIKQDNEVHGGGGFHLIVCRPGGPFGDAGNQVSHIRDVKDTGVVREEIFVSLLNRALDLLSNENGTLFTQIPKLDTPRNIEAAFWKRYMSKIEEKGYKFIFDENSGIYPEKVFAVIKNQPSQVDQD